MKDDVALLASYAATAAMPVAAALLLLLLAGCAPQVQRVAVPVPCRVAIPARPIMPTESLPVDASLDAFVQAAAAEIERREGYEMQLRAALDACK